MEKKVDRVLAPNYLDIIRLEENNPMMDLLTIVDVIHEPFLTGFALANKDTREDQPFLTCLKREVKRLKNVRRLLTTSWRDKTCVILLSLTPHDVTRQGKSRRVEGLRSLATISQTHRSTDAHGTIDADTD